MMTWSGKSIFGGSFQFLDVFQPNVNVNSFTFSNLDGQGDEVYALTIKWLNPLTGAVRLDMVPNGTALPSDSGHVREQYCIDTDIREDSVGANLTIANLQAVVANTYVQGSMYFLTETNGMARFYKTDTFAYDANLALGDRRRVAHRTGLYNDLVTNITSLVFQINTGVNAIGAGSDFRLFKVI